MRLLPRLMVIALCAAPHAAAAQTPEFVPPTQNIAKAPAGTYLLDSSHANVIFKINHVGFSDYYGRFNEMTGTLELDPADITKSKVNVTVDPGSADTTSDELDAKLGGETFFNIAKFPLATFQSTRIEKTGDTTGKIHGDLTLLGVTKPVVLEAKLGGVGENPYSNASVVGFNATATIKRSDFGMKAYLPQLGDEVTLLIEAEFEQSKNEDLSPQAQQ